MKVLAIDPGYGRLGIAVIEQWGNTNHLIFSECFETRPGTPHDERLAAVAKRVREVLAKHRPDAAALEKVFFTKNQKTALRVAEVRGAILSTLSAAKVPIREFTPNQVKVAVTGYGRSDKTHVEKMVRVLIQTPSKKMRDDEVDAVAIGITHLASERHNGREAFFKSIG